MSQTTNSVSGSDDVDSSEYETATNSGTTISSAVKTSPPSNNNKPDEDSVTSDSVASFFEANKAPESDYQAKQREAKEYEARKKQREAERALKLKEFPDLVPVDNKTPMAKEHFTVELKCREWDDDLRQFREKQRRLLVNIRVTSKRKVAALHERIFFTLRWANPVLASIFKKIILEYCSHLMGPFPERKYEKIGVLNAWYSKFSHTPEAKVVEEVKELCERLRVLVLKRDDKTVKTIVKLEHQTELMTIQKEGNVRWHIETRHCARDDYWTIWYLSRRNQVLELERMLQTCKDVDARDPDFGYTPLHYACRENHWGTFSLLLKHGANERAVIEEDGRHPLHLAAQYGTKNMCLELLAVGADFHARDHFGSAALDLAIQSKNYPVITALQNWTQLLPPEVEKVEVVEDLSHVPEEFMSTPYEVLLTMSPALRVITTRLEGSDVTAKHNMDSGMDVGVELRLCERRCEMCADEGFAFEAMKSRKRRWTVAKTGYLRQLEAEVGAEVGASRGSVVLADEEVPTRDSAEQGGRISVDVTTKVGGEGNNPTSLPSIMENTIENDHKPLRSARSDGRQLIKRPPPKLSSSLLYSICSELFEHLIREKLYAEAERVVTDGLAVIDMDDATRVVCLKRHTQLLLFMSDKMSAEERFQSSLVLPSSSAGTHSRTRRGGATGTGTGSGHSRSRVNNADNNNSCTNKYSQHPHVDQSFAPEDFNHTTSYASLNVSDDDSQSYMSDTAPLPPSASLVFQPGAPSSSSSSSEQQQEHHLQHQSSVLAAPSFMSATAPMRLENSSHNEDSHHDNDDHDKQHNDNRDDDFHTRHLHHHDTSADYDQNAAPNSQSIAMLPQNVSPYDVILMRAEGNINEALDLLKKHYDFNFIEPVSLSPLLELAAEIADRQGRFADALHFMEHAGTVKERTLGQAHGDTVRVFIEALRLLLRKQLVLASQRKEQRDMISRSEDKILNESVSSRLVNEKKIKKIRDARNKQALAEDKKRFSEVGQHATDVSRRLDRLALEDEEEARKLSTKCYNLVSLTELIVQGEVAANQVLPTSGQCMSLQSLNSKLFPTQVIRALDRSAFSESDLVAGQIAPTK